MCASVWVCVYVCFDRNDFMHSPVEEKLNRSQESEWEEKDSTKKSQNKPRLWMKKDSS